MFDTDERTRVLMQTMIVFKPNNWWNAAQPATGNITKTINWTSDCFVKFCQVFDKIMRHTFSYFHDWNFGIIFQALKPFHTWKLLSNTCLMLLKLPCLLKNDQFQDIMDWFSSLGTFADRAIYFACVNLFFNDRLETNYLRICWTVFRNLCTK